MKPLASNNRAGTKVAAQGAAKGTAKSAKGAARAADAIAHAHMKRMAPTSVQREEIPLPASLLCHIMLLNSVLERSANRFAEEHGLTMPQWMALGCIGHCGGEGIRHAELGNRLMLSKAPITGVVDRLERAGYVRRVSDASDRRVSRVTITARGEQVWQQVRQTLRGRAMRLCSCLSTAEQETLVSLLARLLEDAAAADPTLPLALGGHVAHSSGRNCRHSPTARPIP